MHIVQHHWNYLCKGEFMWTIHQVKNSTPIKVVVTSISTFCGVILELRVIINNNHTFFLKDVKEHVNWSLIIFSFRNILGKCVKWGYICERDSAI